MTRNECAPPSNIHFAVMCLFFYAENLAIPCGITGITEEVYLKLTNT